MFKKPKDYRGIRLIPSPLIVYRWHKAPQTPIGECPLGLPISKNRTFPCEHNDHPCWIVLGEKTVKAIEERLGTELPPDAKIIIKD